MLAKALAAVNGGAILVIGASESESATLGHFDALIERADRIAIATMLKEAVLPWCELYTTRFSYEKAIRAKPADKQSIDGSVVRGELAGLKASKTRYIIYNQSRKKNGERLMAQLAQGIATASDGVVADYRKPSR